MPAPLHQCAGQPAPIVSVIDAAAAPVALSLERAYATCLGEYVALLRLTGRPGHAPLVAVTLEQTWRDVRGRRPARRNLRVVARRFVGGTQRYVRIRWREGPANPGERWLRVRLLRAHGATGVLWKAAPVLLRRPPPAPASVNTAESLMESTLRLRSRIRAATARLRRARARVAAHPLARMGARARREPPRRHPAAGHR